MYHYNNYILSQIMQLSNRCSLFFASYQVGTELLQHLCKALFV